MLSFPQSQSNQSNKLLGLCHQKDRNWPGTLEAYIAVDPSMEKNHTNCEQTCDQWRGIFGQACPPWQGTFNKIFSGELHHLESAGGEQCPYRTVDGRACVRALSRLKEWLELGSANMWKTQKRVLKAKTNVLDCIGYCTFSYDIQHMRNLSNILERACGDICTIMYNAC